jgi:3-hydroxyacyl-CoA dehydrogenase/enoyl-CoA hydratase/3-hydroxybutyryl-CoA epimerase
MHFFNPVDRMPLVEVIRGAKSSDAAMVTVANFARKLGKTVVYCNDGPGFVVNRILGPYMNESGFLLEEGNSIESLDKAMVDFGMPMGPMALLDEVGIDVASKVAVILGGAFGAAWRARASSRSCTRTAATARKTAKDFTFTRTASARGPIRRSTR